MRQGIRNTLLGGLVVSILLRVLVLGTEFLGEYWSSCNPAITYDAQSYDLKAATHLLDFEVSKQNEAVTRLSDLLHLYLDQSKRLCEHYHEGAISSADYQKALDALGERFALLVRLQEEKPAGSVSSEQVPFYEETLGLLRPDAKPTFAEFGFRVVSDDTTGYPL